MDNINILDSISFKKLLEKLHKEDLLEGVHKDELVSFCSADTEAQPFDGETSLDESVQKEKADEFLQDLQPTTPKSPWFIRALMGAGAWIASFLFFLGFALTGFFSNAVTMGMAGVVIAGIAIFMNRTMLDDKDSVFLEQIALVGSVTGSILLTTSILIESRTFNPELITMTIVFIELIWLFVYRSTVRRFLATLSIGGTLMFYSYVRAPILVQFILIGAAFLIAVFWVEDTSPWFKKRVLEIIHPVRYALVVLMYYILSNSVIFELTVRRGKALILQSHWLIGSAGLAIIWIMVCMRIYQRTPEFHGEAHAQLKHTMLLILVFFCIIAFRSPGVLGGCFILTIGYYRKNLLLMIMAVCTLIGFMVMFYYNLKFSLLVKSAVLMASGILLLGARVYMRHALKETPNVAGEQHA